MKTFTKLFLLFVAFLISVAFTALNPHSIDVNLYAVSVSLPLSAIVVCALFLGIVLGYLTSLSKRLSARRETKKISKLLQSKDAEIQQLRRNPLRDGG